MGKVVLIIGIILIGGVIFASFRRSYLRKKRDNEYVPPKTPLRLAFADLVRIKRNVSRDSYDSVAVMLSDTLRTFLGNIFEYVRPEMTNSEIIEEMNKDAGNDWETLSLVTEVLSLTERVNFAKKRLSVPQQLGLCKKAGTVILKIWRTRRGNHVNQ